MADFIPDTQENFTFVWRLYLRQIKFMAATFYNPKVEFTIPQLQNTTWNFKAYINDVGDDGSMSLGCRLKRKDDKDPESVDVDFSLYTIPVSNNHGDHCGRQAFRHYTKCDFEHVRLYGPYTPFDDSLTIILSMKYDRNEFSNFSEKYLPLCWDVLEVMRTINGYTICSEYGMNYPRHRFVQSKSYFEPAQVFYPLDSSLLDGDLGMQIYPTILSDNISSVFASVINTGIDKLSFEILFINYSARSVRMTCRVGILYSEESHSIALEDHIFPAHLTVDEWRLDQEIVCSEIIKTFSRHSLQDWQWTFDLTFSTFGLPSEIAEKWVEFKISLCHIKDSPLSRFMHVLEKEGPCDFIVKVNDTNFAVHKIILGSLSRWFFFRILGDVYERIAVIKGFRENVIEEMFYFLYTGTLKKSEFETMKKVFYASVHFGIDKLRDKCRNFLIGQLSRKNVTEIEHLSSNTCDNILKEAVESYMKKCSIFSELNFRYLSY